MSLIGNMWRPKVNQSENEMVREKYLSYSSIVSYLIIFRLQNEIIESFIT